MASYQQSAISDQPNAELKADKLKADRFATQFARFLEREESRWVRPAAVVLAREGARAAEAYQQGGEGAALNSVDEREWERYLERVWLSVVPRAGEFTTDQIGGQQSAISGQLNARLNADKLKADSFVKEPPDPFLQAAINWLKLNMAERVQGITQTSKEEIGNQIRIGVSKGEGIADIAARIVKHRRSITPERAQTIARTEVHAAANYGSLVAAELVTVPMEKIWIARADARDSHRAASGQRRALDSSFIVGGYRLMHPGDSSFGAPAGLVVNCRCVMSFEVKRRERRRRAA
jgi:hypothetical protein